MAKDDDAGASNVARETADYLRRHELVIVTAESCTAGLVAARLAEAPGAGKVLEAAFVVYDPGAKQRCLGVPAELLDRCNLTSEPVAVAMATGALRNSDAGLAIANTGVADDTDPAIPAGTQCFAWVFRQAGEPRAFSETRVFDGDRNEIRRAAAEHALRRVPHYHAMLASERGAISGHG
jgi:nicotinamide-nucleotide amidase